MRKYSKINKAVLTHSAITMSYMVTSKDSCLLLPVLVLLYCTKFAALVLLSLTLLEPLPNFYPLVSIILRPDMCISMAITLMLFPSTNPYYSHSFFCHQMFSIINNHFRYYFLTEFGLIIIV